MNTIFSIEITEKDLQNENYNFQPTLTEKLDETDCDFNQNIINEIVLWKVNRYSSLDNEAFNLLNQIKKEDTNINIDITKMILAKLLSTKGIQLAMASTILRFKNPNMYQIIDQRVYRFIKGENLPIYFPNIERQIELYVDYLDTLKSVCINKNIDFKISDRIIYELDKKHNKDEKIRY